VKHRRRTARTCLALVLGLWLLDGCTSDARSTSAARGPESTDMPTWEPVGGLRTPRDDFVSVVVDGEIWVLGGMTGDRGNRLTSIEVFDPDTRSWTTSDIELPVGLASLEGVAVGDRIFVFGGLDATSRPTGFAAVLDTSTGTWVRLPALPHARYAHTVTLHDGRIYVIGGESVAGSVSEVDVFDVGSTSWSPGVPMPRARGSHDTVSTENGLYVLGGWWQGAPSPWVQLYDPAAGTWREAPALPEPMSRGGAAVLDGRLWVSFHEFAAAFDLTTAQWTPANHPPLSRHGHGAVALDGAVYAIGGCQESPLRDVRTVDAMVP
jgi:N-acetylneuraminic acid mutarotase